MRYLFITEKKTAMIVFMENILVGVGLLILGAAFGSFAGAQVWRLRARQLNEDVREGEPVDKKEYEILSPLTKTTFSSDRSRCLNCSKTLAWYDLLPLLSWISTGGKCRYCKSPIGKFELLMELGVAGIFILSYLLWPTPLESIVGLASFVTWLIAVVLLGILFAYDAKWLLLPDRIVFSLIAAGGVLSALKVFQATNVVGAIFSIVGACLVLSGLYFLLWVASKGQWVGFGDVKLGVGLALLLADWRLALLALFLANLIGSLLVIPGMITGKLNRKAQVPFGPLLIAGTVIAMLLGERLIAYYIDVAF